MGKSNKKLYDDLGVLTTATKEKIKGAFRKKAKETHPDKGGDPEQFKAIVKAYSILSDDEKRKRYDAGENPDNLNRADNSETQALNLVVSIFNALVEDIEPEYTNIFDSLRATLRNNQQKAKNDKEGMLNNIKKYNHILKRIKNKGKSDLFINHLNQKITDSTGLITQMDGHIKTCDNALKLIEECEYECDPAQTYTFFSNSGTTTTAGW